MMEHYDGPAFFRKYRKDDDQKKVVQNWPAPAEQSEQLPRSKRQAHETDELSKTRLSDTADQTSISQTQPSQNAGQQTPATRNWFANQGFRPTTVPKQRPQAVLNQPAIDYEKLRQSFIKPDEQVLVFSDEGQGSVVPKTPTPSSQGKTSVMGPTSNLKRVETVESEGELSKEAIAEKKRAAMERLKKRAAEKHARKVKRNAAKTTTPLKQPKDVPNASVAQRNPSKTVTPDSVENREHSPKTSSVAKSVNRTSSNQTAVVASKSQMVAGSRQSTQTSGVKDTEKQTVKDANIRGYQLPPMSLLKPPVSPVESQMDDWIQHQGEVLDETLQAFHVDAHVVDWTVGPTVTQFQISLALGVKVNKITNLTDDLKLALAAKDIRIEAPIPGRTTVGIEIPNLVTRPVNLSEVVQSESFKKSVSPLTVALGVDLFGKPQVTDLRKMPHGLIAGATGAGKSVFINSLLLSLLYKATPAELRLILIDPKAVELAPYDGLAHLLSPVISDPKAAAAALKWAVTEMDERYEQLAAGGVRNIEQFNARAELTKEYGLKMPYIVIVIDELADLMMTASSEVQDYIVRITQKARAAGIHLLIATQRPSVDIVTGVIKNNIPTRVAFMVSSQIDSRTILDSAGAERLLGRGDMLYLGNGAAQASRLQGTFVNEEVDAVTDFVRRQGAPRYAFDPDGLLKTQQVQQTQDGLMPEVLDYIVNEGTVSTSKLQRVFSIGYNRAANLIDTLENNHYISAQSGSKPRDVFLTPKQLMEMRAPRAD